jgi:hypothetical protein
MGESNVKFLKFSLFLALFAAVGLPAAAQTRIKLDIPFTFIAAGKSLPAGHYTVDTVESTDSCAWFISNDHTTVSVMSSPIRSSEKTHGPGLIFLQSGGTYSLVQIWDAEHFGRNVLRSKVKQTVVAQDVKYVAIGAE